ncbi:ABC transporter ATP-binding protein [Sinorhizobium sp. BG8]|uniref:ABC transporter ATP-binding protein n=1 Tax=Sinorhizobium sp. BG8 TaxID=2613773 RepID=UPI00193D8E67|nr:ABC transporter ATP-binding protein [Sinorhizobium sp. BG8]
MNFVPPGMIAAAQTGADPVNAPPLVKLSGLAKNYGIYQAVYPLDLEFGEGDFLAILGPSGCGKTTLLKMLGGFIEPSEGTIVIGGREVTKLPPEKRPTNMVFQGYGLFPHMTIRQNIGYGLRIAGKPRAEVDARVREMLALVQMEAFADKLPPELSGGQQQRIALARALVMRPKVLLLDEPFAALDLKLRQAMQEELRRLHREIGGTFVFVTHDQAEAMSLATKVVVMSRGRVEQVGTAEEIYLKPKTHFVSTFVGEANFLKAKRKLARVAIEGAFSFDDPGPDGDVLVGVRPEKVRLGKAASGCDHRFSGQSPSGSSSERRYNTRFISGTGKASLPVDRTATSCVVTKSRSVGRSAISGW